MDRVENGYSEHLVHCEERKSIDSTVACAEVCVSLIRLEELPREHAGPAA